MTSVSEALGKISKALGVLAYQIASENRAGFFSKNRLSEDLLLPLFRLVFDAPDLRNLNSDTANYPYIDLADTTARIAIQVTSERTARKVTGTLTNFMQHSYHEDYDRLIIFVLTPQALNYTDNSKTKWKQIAGEKLEFDPTSDIIGTLDLFALIEALDHSTILEIQEIVTRSIVGEEFVDVESHLQEQVHSQLDYEKNTGKYIPDVFVESRKTKNLARCFAHPALFVHRTVESLQRLKLPTANSTLAKAGQPMLLLPDLSHAFNVQSLAEAESAALRLREDLSEVRSLAGAYEGIKHGQPPPFPVPPANQPFYDANTFTVLQIGWGVARALDDLFDELQAINAKVLIVTGRAGQGKTNFVCDLVERFLSRHGVPCAFLSGRRISALNAVDLGDAVQRLVFRGKTSSFPEAAELFSAHAQRAGKPFILLIDGINEHPQLSKFAVQLEAFIREIARYDDLKLLLTCRSEFFEERFARIVAPPHDSYTMMVESNAMQTDAETNDELVGVYFDFFELDAELIGDHVIDVLTKDVLLLRFFCEAYGARGKHANYQQRQINTIYREKIFKTYLEQKIGTATEFFGQLTGRIDPVEPSRELWEILTLVVQHMLETGHFTDVPMSIVPKHLNDALFALLDEDLILRRDLSSAKEPFSSATDAINFTFDEFRDFIVAQYLLHRVYVDDKASFDKIVTTDPAESQIVEGVKRFLFYASRDPENHTFLEYYRTLDWYSDVYVDEIFNVDPQHLGNEDRDRVLAGLKNGGHEASVLARRLAVRWHGTHHPLLNLDLLISFVAQCSDEEYDAVVFQAFTSYGYGTEGRSMDAFCGFIRNKILSVVTPDVNHSTHNLFRFLVLLLPVDSSPNLTSVADSLFREVIDQHHAYAIALLEDALAYTPTRHKAHVWRLLTTALATVNVPTSLISQATLIAANDTGDSVVRREANRFVEHAGKG